MDEAKLSRLRAYYDSLADEALRAEVASGRDAFTPEAWAIVSGEIERRALQSVRTSSQQVSRQNEVVVASPHTRMHRLRGVAGVISGVFRLFDWIELVVLVVAFLIGGVSLVLQLF